MSIVEKLRGSLEYETGCSADFIAIALTDDRAFCKGTCADCRKEWVEKLADAIEAELKASKPAQLPEGVEWPRYESGELVKFGDKFVDVHGCEAKAKMVIFGAEGFVFNAGYSPKFCRGYGTPVKRPEPEVPDTQEAIDEDCWLDAKDYCEKHNVKTEWPKHYGKAKCEHLLARQRKLLGGK